MCLASKYLGEIEKVITDLRKDKAKLQRKQSEYDKKLSEYYHKLETAKFNACEGYYKTKELQSLLQKRRLVKHELHRMNQIEKYLSKSLSDRIENARNVLNESIDYNAEYTQNFSIRFSDIEEEVLH
ncbi:hypothetical protein [Bacillus infantis]|uniref:hypothetical protein n=1 Tax=Bacillus infantis TaxID=324767 RepID=UPI003CEF3803